MAKCVGFSYRASAVLATDVVTYIQGLPPQAETTAVAKVVSPRTLYGHKLLKLACTFSRQVLRGKYIQPKGEFV